MGPLAGIRILDLTTVVMGPYATSVLGDMGAEVIKVESPEGDILRQVGPSRSGEMGGLFLHANRSKRSIVLDLKRPEARAALLKLAESADVLIHNLRPQAMARLGLDYAALAAVNPAIIHAGAFGFGQDGPYAARPAYDDLMQGIAGIPSLMAQSGGGTPRYVPVNIADRIVGLHAAIAVLGALQHRSRTGEGQSIEIPMFETMASFVLGDHLGGMTHRPALDQGGYARLLTPNRRPYATADGHLCVLIYNDKHWRSFFGAIDRPDLAADPRFASHASRIRHTDAICAELAAILATRPTAEWEVLLDAAGIPHTPLHTLDSLVEDPHLAAVGFFTEEDHPAEGPVRGMKVASRWSASQPEPSRLAPRLGEHTAEILREAGLSEAEIAAATAPPG
ncbi:CoA transferase [Pseudoroseomonas deserti]|uniref:CoA transferase n=1 Tax=Teichococcus deserti TaxID=1817963 RepID=A0A1V2GZB0_9PROT|nr:CoA transferase [Pseudoroseomonas deserti]ONG48214.1 CoA transferase [Pseudoroseomonas deserti]